MSTPKKIFVIGGTGAQGIPVIRGLVSDGKYSVRVLTRDPTSSRAQEIKALNPSHVELVQGTFASEADLRAGFAGVYGAFINIDGHAAAEKTETFWAIRAYELAIQSGIRMFVYGNLDYSLKASGFDESVRAGHIDGKGRMGEWIRWQNADNKGKPWYNMKVATFTTSAYADMVIAAATPMAPVVEEVDGEKVLTWRMPLTEDGAVPHVSLEDCGYYVRWLFDNEDRADGMDLKVAIEHVHYTEMAKAFEKVTGHKARFIDTDMETYWKEGPMSTAAALPSGYTATLDDPATITVQQNFTGFWNLFRKSGYNKGIAQRDYALLDEIHPNRIRSMEQFFRREDEIAKKAGSSLWEKVSSLTPILKLNEDMLRAIQAEAQAGQAAQSS